MKNSYYYYEKKSPLKRIIIAAALLVVAGAGYWYYENYFKTAGTVRTPNVQADAPAVPAPSGWGVRRVTGVAYYSLGDARDLIRVQQGDTLQVPFSIKVDSGRVDLAYTGDSTGMIFLDAGSEFSATPERFYTNKGRIRLIAGLTYADRFAFENARMIASTAVDLMADPVKHTITLRPVAAAEIYGALDPKATADDALTVELLDTQGTNETLFATTIATNSGQQVVVKTDGDYRTVFTYSPARVSPTDPFDAWVREGLTQPASPAAVSAPDYSLTLTAQRDGGTVRLAWPAYTGSDFTEYQILTGTQRAPEYGAAPARRITDAATVTADMTVATDKESTTYYRVCIVRAGSGILCSTPSIVQVERPRPQFSAPALSGFVTDFGMALSWSPSDDGRIVDYYLVRSSTNAQPAFPADGYIAKFGSGVAQYTDAAVTASTGGVAYYRLCAGAGQDVACSATLTVRDGVLQP